MTLRVAVLASCLVAATAVSGQERHKLVINTETEEGKLLQNIGQETDPARKLALMEDFVAKHPKHEGAGWVYSQMQPMYTKAGQHDKALAVADKLVSLDGMDLDAAYAALKAAEARKDPDLIMKWSAKTGEIAARTAASPQPAEADQVETWKGRVDFAKQMVTYTEYALFAAALGNPGPQKTVMLVEALEQRNPKSEYLPKLYAPYIVALSQSAPDKVVPTAERLSAADPTNEDLLLVLADGYMNKQQNDKTLAASTKLIEVLKTKPKPEGMADADWEKKKNNALGRAYWYSGIVNAATEKWGAADQSLRSALPLIQGNDQLSAPALFYLGLANYRLGKGKNKVQLQEAIRFTEQAAAIKGPFQSKAAQNAKAFREGR
jgi:hypothetical protein